MGYKETYNRWLTSDVVDEDTKAELKSIENNEKEIEERADGSACMIKATIEQFSSDETHNLTIVLQ